MGEMESVLVADEDFGILINSVGEYTWGHLRSLGVRELRVAGDEAMLTATLAITLKNDSWETRLAALQRLADVRATFLDELALDFRFEGADADTASPVPSTVERVFA
jgi:hypothetical protein